MTTLFIPTKSEDQISHEAIVENSMTETEKLRALLAEARRVVGDEVCIDCGVGSQMLWGRIDAALAEPVGECARCETLRDLADKAAWAQGDAQRRMIEEQKQRDEARAEIASLKAELSPMLLAVATSTDERDIARAKAEMAYQRGAEAMRTKILGLLAVMSLDSAPQFNGYSLWDRIGMLGLPEEKP